MDVLAGFLVLALFLGGIFVYFVPAIVGDRRSHPNSTAIFVLNLLLGWTLVGWVAALVWALSKPTVVIQESQPAPTPSEASVTTPPREERECPYCAEPILVRAKICKHCGKDVALPDLE